MHLKLHRQFTIWNANKTLVDFTDNLSKTFHIYYLIFIASV